MAFTEVTLTQNFDLADGTEPSGTITFTPTAPMLNSGVVVPAAPVAARLNGAGTITITLAANTDTTTTPTGTAYAVVEAINGVTRTYSIQVPHDQGSELTLYSLAQLATPPALSFPAGGGDMFAANNLSDLVNAGTARANLGLATIAASGSASDLTAGTAAPARLGSGTPSASTFLRGDGSWAEPVAGAGGLVSHRTLGDATPKIGVPLYVFPDYASTPSVWNTIADIAPYSRFVIANPNTGPGASSDPFYVTQIQRMQASGVFMLGYVSTHYASVAFATVMADVANWIAWYGIDGIFLDETTYNSDQAHYQSIYDAIKALDPNLIVVSNPGLGVDVSMEPTSDIFMSFEGDPTAYRARPGIAAPAWEHTAPAWRFWHLVHSVADLAEAQEMLGLARDYRAGTIFVTDQTMPNPWLGLPSSDIWDAQVAFTRESDAVTVRGDNGLSNLRLRGRKTTTGAPAAGTWATGDAVIDSAGAWHLCTAGGTPGTWT